MSVQPPDALTLRATFLGTGTALPTPTHGPSGTLLQYGDSSVLVDIGAGVVQKLCTAGVTPHQLDALLLTHAHIDHIGDLTTLLFAFHVPAIERDAPLEVVATPECLAIVRRFIDAAPSWLDIADSIVRYTEIAPGVSHRTGAFEIETAPIIHHESSIGYRFGVAGLDIAIPGDTVLTEPLVALCRDADLAVVECSNPDGLDVGDHMQPSTLAELAERAQPARIAVVHRYPEAFGSDLAAAFEASIRAAVEPAFDGRLLFPSDGDSVTLST